MSIGTPWIIYDNCTEKKMAGSVPLSCNLNLCSNVEYVIATRDELIFDTANCSGNFNVQMSKLSLLFLFEV